MGHLGEMKRIVHCACGLKGVVASWCFQLELRCRGNCMQCTAKLAGMPETLPVAVV